MSEKHRSTGLQGQPEMKTSPWQHTAKATSWASISDAQGAVRVLKGTKQQGTDFVQHTAGAKQGMHRGWGKVDGMVLPGLTQHLDGLQRPS